MYFSHRVSSHQVSHKIVRKNVSGEPLIPFATSFLHCGLVCAGARLQRFVGVQVQVLYAPQLEFGVVDEVFDDQQGSQPVVRLTSGTVGAVRISLCTCMHCIVIDTLMRARPLPLRPAVQGTGLSFLCTEEVFCLPETPPTGHQAASTTAVSPSGVRTVQVTLIESERLPPQSMCIEQLAHKPFVTAVPLGDDYATKIVAQVAGVMDNESSPPVVTIMHSETGEEVVAQLSALMVPFTLPKSAQLCSRQPEKPDGSTAWRSPPEVTVPAPSAWKQPSTNAAPIEGSTQARQGLKVRKTLTAAWSCVPEGERDGSEATPVRCRDLHSIACRQRNSELLGLFSTV